MIFNLVLLSVVALVAGEPEPVAVGQAVQAPSPAPALAYLAAPLVVGAQRAPVGARLAAPLVQPAPAPFVVDGARTLIAYTAAPSQQQYFARTYNGLTTLTLDQREPVAAPLVVAPAEPAPSRYVAELSTPARLVLTSAKPAPAPARVVVAKAEPAPAPVRFLVQQQQQQQQQPAAYFFTQEASPAPVRPLVQQQQPAAYFFTHEPAPAPAPAARVLAVTPAKQEVAVEAPASSSTQYFARNFNGVPTVTYFVVGPAPAPVAVAPQQAPGSPRRPAPAPGAVPAGEPVNQGDVEVLDA